MPKHDQDLQHTVSNAKSIGVNLRIDVARDALVSGIRKLKSDNKDASQIRVGIYTFSNLVDELVPPTSDLDTVIQAAENLDLATFDPIDAPHVGGTYIENAILELNHRLKSVSPVGKSSSLSNRKSYIVLISDGVENNNWYERTSNLLSDGTPQYLPHTSTIADWTTGKNSEVFSDQILQSFDPKNCDVLKKAGRNVISAHIEYPDFYGADAFPSLKEMNDYIISIQPDLKDAFKKCASSPQLSFFAKDSDELHGVVTKIIEELSSQPLYVSR